MKSGSDLQVPLLPLQLKSRLSATQFYRLKSSNHSSLDFSNYQFIIKEYNLERAWRERRLGQGGEKSGASKLYLDSSYFPWAHRRVFTALQTLSLGFFMEASLLWHDWLNCSSLYIDSTLSPTHLPGCGPGWRQVGVETEPNLLITVRFPILGRFQSQPH